MFLRLYPTDFHDLSLPELVFQYDFSHRWLSCHCMDYVLKRRCKYRISFLRCELGDHFWWPHGGDEIWHWIVDQGSLDISNDDGVFDMILESEFYKDICRIYVGYKIEVKWGIYRVGDLA